MPVSISLYMHNNYCAVIKLLDSLDFHKGSIFYVEITLREDIDFDMEWTIVVLLCALYCNCDGLQNDVTVVIGNSSATRTISIGYIMDQLMPPYRIGAIKVGIEDGQRNGLLQNYNFRFVIKNLLRSNLMHIVKNCELI